ncbi:type II toxin-antitoxin system RelE/ParE family toxin [Variovorax beijingensis]|uniref:Type II toxin-antitoxin system RelE/ParE family toxin n=1 Tax=Variovorax beijingensis TaxID=2496117 RepID=A0ABY0A076_9BURK|nr:type II toxin-antitoxin system RelE/ParE family toxin [Variovorax beijingensis]RSZ30838.1 type II toxin-antitoxin system RelE/ParE family toxin [Variovorax beijingensis]
MPQVRFAPAALRDLQRPREFLRPKNPAAAQRAAETIIKAVQVLRQQPMVGRPVEDLPPEYREWVIDFGASGYVALYRYAGEGDEVTVLALRHQREVGYEPGSTAPGS